MGGEGRAFGVHTSSALKPPVSQDPSHLIRLLSVHLSVTFRDPDTRQSFRWLEEVLCGHRVGRHPRCPPLVGLILVSRVRASRWTQAVAGVCLVLEQGAAALCTLLQRSYLIFSAVPGRLFDLEAHFVFTIEFSLIL